MCSLELRSALGEGTKVTIHLPVSRSRKRRPTLKAVETMPMGDHDIKVLALSA